VFVQLYPYYGIGEGTDNWDGVFPQKNALGFATGLGLVLLLVAGRAAARFRHVFYLGAGINAYLLVRSESKTMWVATSVSLALMLVYVMFRSRRTLRGAVMAGLLGGSALTIAFVTANITVLARWLDKDVSLTGRVPLWESLFPVAMERFALGHGYRAAFGGYFSPVHEVLVEHTWDPPSAHNGLMQVWLELGLIGVAVFVALYIRSIRRAITYVQTSTGVCGLWPLTFFTMALLISIAESGINYKKSGWMLFVVAVLVVSAYAKDRPRSIDLRPGFDGGDGPGRLLDDPLPPVLAPAQPSGLRSGSELPSS
jgi:O-antigen ligase